MRCRLISDDTIENTQDEQASQNRLKAIKSILSATCLQLLIVAGLSSFIIQASFDLSRLYLLLAMIACGTAAYYVDKMSGRLSTGLVTLGFIFYTIGLISLMLFLSTFVTKESIFDGIIQLSLACSGLTCYAWTTTFYDWSHVEESMYCAVPCILSTMVFWLVLSRAILPLLATLACVLIWSFALADCTKDVLIPPSSTS